MYQRPPTERGAAWRGRPARNAIVTQSFRGRRIPNRYKAFCSAGLSLVVLQGLTSGRWGRPHPASGLRSVLALHRKAGMAALIIVIGHVVVPMIDDPARLALPDPRDAPTRRAGMVALVALLALAGTSVWRRRLRLRYEHWRAVHVLCAVTVIGGSAVYVVGVGAHLSVPAWWTALTATGWPSTTG